MFKLFPSNPAASTPIETLPGGPSPDTAVPMRDEAISRPYHAPTESAGTEPRPPPHQPPRNPTIANTRARYLRGSLSSEAREENNPAVVGADGGSGELSLREEAKRSASVKSRRGDRSIAVNVMSNNSAATAANEAPDVDPSLRSRAASAEKELESRDKAAINKEEHNVGRRLSKIIKREAKTEKATLQVALKELEEIQKLQKASIKEEAASHSRHSRALSDAHKAEMELLAARTANERGKAGLRAAGDVLEASRRHARETTDMLREKMEEVERLRINKQVDDRERAIKVRSLVGEDRKRLSRILRSG